MLKKRFFLFLAAAAFLAGCISIPEEIFSPLPMDPAVVRGTLDNGLTYYIRENRKPRERASLRLVVKAGSLLEEEDQQGLAHLVEHMAFNGTVLYEKLELIHYLESIGMDFGPEINAYTGFEETVYMLEIPTDDGEILEKGFEVLKEWARYITMNNEDIESERLVIQEEWRLGRGASGRIRDQILPVLLQDSRYAERLPIGKVEVFMNTPADRVRDFYRDWYRPDLMAVVAVGDFNASDIESLIQGYFDFPAAPEPTELPGFPVPGQEGTRVKVVADPEVAVPQIELAVLRSPLSLTTREDYRAMLVRNLFWSAFNQRLSELSREEKPPFIGARGGEGNWVSSASFVSLSASLGEEKILTGLNTLTEELVRAVRYGLTPGELRRGKEETLLFITRAFKEKDNIPSSSLAGELVEYHLRDVFMPGVEGEYDLTRELLPLISLEEVNLYAGSLFPRDNRIVTLILPESLVPPGEAEILDAIALVEARTVMPPEERDPGTLEGTGGDTTPGAVEKRLLPAWGAEEWILANGARVIVKPTDFMDDQVLFSAVSPGGLSLEEDELYHDGLYSLLVLQESGLAGFSAGDLKKVLSGRDVSVFPYLGDHFEGFRGGGSPDELETLLQLTRLYFTEPRFDEGVYVNLKERLGEVVKNRLADPVTQYRDRLQEILSSGSYRRKPLDQELLETMTLEEGREVYQRRFAGAGDFTFLFVGTLNLVELEGLASAYLGTLPQGPRETWIDRGIRPPQEQVDERVRKGLEPQGRVTLVFHGEGEFTAEDEKILSTLGEILEVNLRELIREELGGTYSVRAGVTPVKQPYSGWSGSVEFGCDPARVDELTGRIYGEIDKLRNGEIAQSHLDREIEQYRRTYQVNLRENSFWLDTMARAVREGADPEPPLSPEEFAALLTRERLVELAGRVFANPEQIRVVLVPGVDEIPDTPAGQD